MDILNQIHVRISDERKRALRILAAEKSFSDLSAYVLHVLATRTEMDARAAALTKFSSKINQNDSQELESGRSRQFSNAIPGPGGLRCSAVRSPCGVDGGAIV